MVVEGGWVVEVRCGGRVDVGCLQGDIGEVCLGW